MIIHNPSSNTRRIAWEWGRCRVAGGYPWHSRYFYGPLRRPRTGVEPLGVAERRIGIVLGDVAMTRDSRIPAGSSLGRSRSAVSVGMSDATRPQIVTNSAAAFPRREAGAGVTWTGLRWDSSAGNISSFSAVWQEARRTTGSFSLPAVVLTFGRLVMSDTKQSPVPPAKNERRKPRQPEKKIGPFAGGVGVAIWMNRAQTDDGPKMFRSITINPRRFYDQEDLNDRIGHLDRQVVTCL